MERGITGERREGLSRNVYNGALDKAKGGQIEGGMGESDGRKNGDKST